MSYCSLRKQVQDIRRRREVIERSTQAILDENHRRAATKSANLRRD